MINDKIDSRLIETTVSIARCRLSAEQTTMSLIGLATYTHSTN